MTLLYSVHPFITAVEINGPSSLKITSHYTPLHYMTSSYLGCFVFVLNNSHSSHSPLPFSRYLFSGVVSFSLLAGASCRSGRLAKSSCSASPIARDRTTIFPSLDTHTHTQTDRTSQDHRGMWANRHRGTHIRKTQKEAGTDTPSTHSSCTKTESGRKVVDCCEDTFVFHF